MKHTRRGTSAKKSKHIGYADRIRTESLFKKAAFGFGIIA
jgi:hypothetical protein